MRVWHALMMVGVLAPALFIGSAKLSPAPEISPPAPATVVSDHQGQPLRIFADKQGIHRYLSDSTQVDPFYLQALIAYEDQRYYQHTGVDWLAFARALGQWVQHGRVVSGASTLSMQTARLIWPYRRTPLGKLQQMWRALRLESHYSKQEILTEYLNRAPFGGTLEGVEAAARRYFGKSAKKLTGPESMLLVVLPQKPSRFRPDTHPEVALSARNKVIRRLQKQTLIHPDTADRWLAAPLGVKTKSHPLVAPLLARRMRQQHPEQAHIQTTIDGGLQRQVEAQLNLWAEHAKRAQSAAVLVVDNHSANVLAYAGSVDFLSRERSGHVDMVRAVRSPGSTLKPFVYAQGIDRGVVHEASLLTDVPRNFNGYQPSNFDGQYRGAITLRKALQSSRNVPAVQVLQALGDESFVQRLDDAGLKLRGAEKARLSLVLGGVGSNLETLVRAYVALASGGRVPTLQHQDSGAPHWQPWLSEEAAWIVWNILADNVPPNHSARSTQRRIAWKTGTSYGFRDAWAIGVSARYTVGIWSGRPDGSPIVGAMGLQEAVPLLFDVFGLLPQESQQLKRPAGVQRRTICWPGGRSRTLTLPSQCLRKKPAWTQRGITPPTLYEHPSEQARMDWPRAITEWQSNLPVASKPTLKPMPLRILGLRDGQTLFRQQRVQWPLKSNRRDPISWYINGEFVENPLLDLNVYENGPLKLVAAAEQGDFVSIELRISD